MLPPQRIASSRQSRTVWLVSGVGGYDESTIVWGACAFESKEAADKFTEAANAAVAKVNDIVELDRDPSGRRESILTIFRECDMPSGMLEPWHPSDGLKYDVTPVLLF